MKKLYFGRAGFWLGLAVLVMTAVPLSMALADISVTSVTLNGDSEVTVAPDENITVGVTVARSGHDENNDWEATSWNISGDGQGQECVNTADHTNGNGSNTESFSITAPSYPGTYDVTIKIYRDDNSGWPFFFGGCFHERDSMTLDASITVAGSGTVTINKVVINDNGGTATAEDFTLYVGETEVSNGVPSEIPAGNYVIDEGGPLGYQPSFVGDCDSDGNITIGTGGFYTCTITNDDQPGTLRVNKFTLPDSDISTEFTITASGSGFIDGDATRTITGGATVDYAVDAGTYSVDEEPMNGDEETLGWDIASNTCDDIEVGVGETQECTITNTQHASLKITKLTDPADLYFDFEVSGGPGGQEGIPATIDNLGNGESETFFDILPGDYNIMELDSSLPEGWTGSQMMVCSAANGNNPGGSVAQEGEGGGKDITLNPGDQMECTVNNTQDGVVVGMKFEDMDGNGEGNSGGGLSGWQIDFFSQEDMETPVLSEITNESGHYTARLQPGTYQVCEVGQPGWYPSYPGGSLDTEQENVSAAACDGHNGYLVTVAAAGGANGIDFGNYKKGTVAGTKWHDQDADGVFDFDEPGLGGWTIQISGDYYSDTEETLGGNYTFTEVPPGEYVVSELPQDGWVQTFPGGNEGHSIVTVSNGALINVDFGNTYDATISGIKWNDLNVNGANDQEPNLPGWTIYVDLDDDGVHDGNEPSAVTDETGYEIAGLLPGTYVVREVQQGGWGQTFPAEGSHTVTLGLDGNATGIDFGNADAATASGMKWNDEDADGEFGEGEDGIGGWTIVATPILDPEGGEADETRSEKETTTAANGSYSFDFLLNEFGWWRISEVQQEGWTQTSAPAYHDIFIESSEDAYGEGLDFGNWQSPIVQVVKWNDDDESGTQNSDQDIPLEGWPMALGRVIEGESPSSTYVEVVDTALTDSEGVARLFAPADAGDYVVLEGAMDDWNMTYPAPRSEDLVISFAPGVEPLDLDASSFFNVEITLGMNGETIDRGYVPSDDEEDEEEFMKADLEFGNHETPTGGPTGGGDGSNNLGRTDDNGLNGEVLGAATSTEGTLGASCQLPLTTYLRRGRANNPSSVKDLQNFLNAELAIEPPIPLTGFFGPVTEAAVKAFQLKYYDEVLKPWVDLGLLPADTATGIVYKMTLWKIQMLGCPGLDIPKPALP